MDVIGRVTLLDCQAVSNPVRKCQVFYRGITVELDTSSLNTTLTIVFFFMLFLGFIATPIGFVVALLVRRMMPLVNVLLAAIVAAYVVGVVVIFVILRALFTDERLNVYAALTGSVIASAGIVFAIAYIIHRIIISRAPSLTAEEKFAVFGEDLRAKPKSARRHKRR
jgi:ABC-type sugar transport system permease subunit